MAACALVLALAIACGENPTRPRAQGGAPSLRAEVAAGDAEGCARLHVTVRGRAEVFVELIDSTCDGLALAVAGRPTFDRVSQRVRVPLGIVNRSGRTVQAPAFLYAWPADLTVIASPGLAGNNHALDYLHFSNPDSLGSETGDGLGGAAIFRMDSLLASAGGTPRLAAGDTSQAHWVEIEVKQGVDVFEAVVHARATPARPPVPAVSPDTVPRSVFDSINWGPPSSCMAGDYVRNVVMILFRTGTPQAERQAAIDAVHGEVVGGDREYGDDGYYYVRIPDDGTGEPLCRSLSILKTMPQVNGTVVIEWNFTGTYLKPKDGAGWEHWELDPAEAGGARWGLEAIAAPMHLQALAKHT